MHRATDAGLYLKPPCLSITIVNIGDRRVPAGDGAFRYCDFLGSRRGYLSQLDAVVIPRLVQPNTTAGSAVIGPQSSHSRASYAPGLAMSKASDRGTYVDF